MITNWDTTLCDLEKDDVDISWDDEEFKQYIEMIWKHIEEGKK